MRSRPAVAAVLLFACGGAARAPARPPAGSPIVVRIDATRTLREVPEAIFGANVEYIGAATPAGAQALRGTPAARFPGGDDVSRFVWDEPSAGECASPRWTWAPFAGVAARERIALMLETNAVRGSPDGTAQWLRDARARGLRVPWVCIGNEVWGEWDAGFRPAARYASEVRAHAAAIRAVSPEARVVLEVGTSNEDVWNREALRGAADVVDALDYHYYPNHEERPDPLVVAAGADGIGPLVERLRAMIRAEAPARAGQIGIVIGEWDGAADPPRPGPPEAGRAYCSWSMPDALFYGAAPGEMLLAGVEAAFFYEQQGYRFGATPGDACTVADSSVVRPKYLVMRLWREHFGDRLVAAETEGAPTFFSAGPTRWDGFRGTAPYVRAYASLAEQGRSLRVVLVNRHPEQAMAVSIDLRGFVPARAGLTWVVAGDSMMATNELGDPDRVRIDPGTVVVRGRVFPLALRAHSVTALELRRRP